MSFNKDLIYICKHVSEWPDSQTATIYYCMDGEILGLGKEIGEQTFDLYPEGSMGHSNPNFIPDLENGFKVCGKEYSKEEFLACKEYLYRQGNPSVAELQDVVSEKVKSRIKEIRKRYTEDYKREITPLLEVLQRRGVNCDEFIEF